MGPRWTVSRHVSSQQGMFHAYTVSMSSPLLPVCWFTQTCGPFHNCLISFKKHNGLVTMNQKPLKPQAKINSSSCTLLFLDICHNYENYLTDIYTLWQNQCLPSLIIFFEAFFLFCLLVLLIKCMRSSWMNTNQCIFTPTHNSYSNHFILKSLLLNVFG